MLQENPDTQAIEERNWTFNYDDLDQLASVTNDGVTLYSYPYNAIGNRTDAGSVSTMNQYASFQYNGRGDVTDDGNYSYTWDAKDRLVAAEPDSLNAQSQKDVFTYDPENRRTQEDIFTWDAANQDWVRSSTLKFVYDGSQMVAELDGQNHLLQSYAWGPTGTLLNITDYSGGTPTNYQVVTDGSGSVVELLDSSTGLVAASYQYDPWGNPLCATGPAANVSPFRWQGEFYDANFGGYYMGAREGSARLHIFLSPDPSGEGSDANLYRMVGNDPINNVDPDGLEAKRSSIGGSETTNFLSTKDITTLPNGDRQITYHLLLNQETIASLGVGARGFYAHLTKELASVQHVFSGPQAAQNEAMADKIVASKVDSLNQMDVAGARVDNMKVNFGLIPFFIAIDNYQQGQPWKLDAALSVLAVLPAERVVGSTVSAVEASEAVEATRALSYLDNETIDFGLSNAGLAGSLQTGIPQGVVIGAEAKAETSTLLSGVQSFTSAPLTFEEDAAVPAIQIPQAARPLNILNSGFTPDAAGILQAHVDSVSAALAANPALARQVLSADELTHFLNPSSSTYAATWGKAVERLTAVQIEDNPFSNSFLQHIGGPNEPDFVGRAATFAEDHMFDITTVQSESAHYTRWYGQDVYYIHYWRP